LKDASTTPLMDPVGATRIFAKEDFIMNALYRSVAALSLIGLVAIADRACRSLCRPDCSHGGAADGS